MNASPQAATHAPHKPHHHTPDADDFEPNLLPVDPDQGLGPPVIPAAPEHERSVDPEA